VILLDGPMGTELEARGVSTDGEGEGWSAYALDTAPAVVEAIHRDYVRAGATVHRTNTFRTQPRIFADRWSELLERAVAIARAAGCERVAGSIAPVFDCYRPDLSPGEDARGAHRSMARAFAASKVDLLVCETFPHGIEARVAVEEAVATGLETWVALTAGPDGSLMTPEAMEANARDCVSAGASAVLVCCTAASLTARYVDRLARIPVRGAFGAYANIGANRSTMTSARYAALAKDWRSAGATILGACCGTSPAYIEALAADALAR